MTARLKFDMIYRRVCVADGCKVPGWEEARAVQRVGQCVWSARARGLQTSTVAVPRHARARVLLQQRALRARW